MSIPLSCSKPWDTQKAGGGKAPWLYLLVEILSLGVGGLDWVSQCPALVIGSWTSAFTVEFWRSPVNRAAAVVHTDERPLPRMLGARNTSTLCSLGFGILA